MKRVTIAEGKRGRVFENVRKIRTLKQNGDFCLWIPEDDVPLTSLYASENGVYHPRNDNAYGYRDVTVDIYSQDTLERADIVGNGEYDAQTLGIDGFDSAYVDVKSSSRSHVLTCTAKLAQYNPSYPNMGRLFMQQDNYSSAWGNHDLFIADLVIKSRYPLYLEHYYEGVKNVYTSPLEENLKGIAVMVGDNGTEYRVLEYRYDHDISYSERLYKCDINIYPRSNMSILSGTVQYYNYRDEYSMFYIFEDAPVSAKVDDDYIHFVVNNDSKWLVDSSPNASGAFSLYFYPRRGLPPHSFNGNTYYTMNNKSTWIAGWGGGMCNIGGFLYYQTNDQYRTRKRIQSTCSGMIFNEDREFVDKDEWYEACKAMKF